MFETEVTLKKSGSKLTAEIPQHAVAREHLMAGQRVKITVSKKSNGNVIRETFGTIKTQKADSRTHAGSGQGIISQRVKFMQRFLFDTYAIIELIGGNPNYETYGWHRPLVNDLE